MSKFLYTYNVVQKVHKVERKKQFFLPKSIIFFKIALFQNDLLKLGVISNILSLPSGTVWKNIKNIHFYFNFLQIQPTFLTTLPSFQVWEQILDNFYKYGEFGCDWYKIRQFFLLQFILCELVNCQHFFCSAVCGLFP